MKLSLAIDMGATYNGLFIANVDNSKILDKKASCIIFDNKNLNFQKISRRNNRHRKRALKRRKLAKRLIRELVDFNSYTIQQQELILGLFNRRGYTFLTSAQDFEINEELSTWLANLENIEISSCQTKEDLENYFSNIENEDAIISECDNILSILPNKKFKDFKEFLITIKKDILLGSKHRKTYLKEIKNEIYRDFDFIEEFTVEHFYNLVGNISNLQLRILRKYFNNKYDDLFDDNKLYNKLKKYFKRFHDSNFQNNTLSELNKYDSSLEFLKNCPPELTIPPYEDMNNRNTYKCNSMLIKDEVITNTLKQSIDTILNTDEFKFLNGSHLSYTQKLQRFLDVNSKLVEENIHPRNVFKHCTSNTSFYKNLLQNNYDELENLASKYYEQENKIIQGLYNDSFIFRKCNHNTPYKNNIKHILLTTLLNYHFTEQGADELKQQIESAQKLKGNLSLKGYLKKISDIYKLHKNSFYSYVLSNFDNPVDKDIKKIIDNMDLAILSLKEILSNKKTYLDCISNVNKDNLFRILNIFRQVYDILFNDIKGFTKTCKQCSIENSIRSDENNPICKRLLSDVAKPIDGILDFMLDRLAFEIVQQVDSLENIEEVEIILEQNRFNFEDSLSQLKGRGKKNVGDKSYLTSNICPYLEKDTKIANGEYDHIIPRSQKLHNSRANLIYCSTEGNRKKLNKIYTLEQLNKKHLRDIFGTDDLNIIKDFIEKYIHTIDEKNFTNFDNLNLNQQKAFRYALFMVGTPAHKKALSLLEKDKVKIFSNGTQKRLGRLIYQKLLQKFGNVPDTNIKTVDSKIVSVVRKSIYLETNEEKIFKQEYQSYESHSIDAMVAFYIENYNFDFLEDIYVKYPNKIDVDKRKKFINSHNISSFQLFQDTIYNENYKHIDKEFIKKNKNLVDFLIEKKVLYVNKKNKKVVVKAIEDNDVLKVDVQKLSNLLLNLFKNRDIKNLKLLKPLDKIRYNTVRKDIKDIFMDKNHKQLNDFGNIKGIPPYNEKIFRAIYKKLKSENNLFTENGINEDTYEKLMKNIFKPQKRKRNKKRHIYSLPVLGQNAQYRVKRKNLWQVIGGDKIATKSYLVDNDIIPVPFFSRNTIPLKIEDMLNCIKYLLSKSSYSIYSVNINTERIKSFVRRLKYIVSEKSRLVVDVEFYKKPFNINFELIENFDASKDIKFKMFLKNFLNNKEHILHKYLGSIRGGTKEGKATLIYQNKEIIRIRYTAETSKDKKQIIIENVVGYK